MTRHQLVISWHFRGACYLNFQGRPRGLGCIEETVTLYRERAGYATNTMTQTRQMVLCSGQNMLGRIEIMKWKKENPNKGSEGNTDLHDEHEEEQPEIGGPEKGHDARVVYLWGDISTTCSRESHASHSHCLDGAQSLPLWWFSPSIEIW
jgi:hypothetical protein